MTPELHEAAATLAQRGWHVIPLRRRGKTPLIKDWPSLASVDATTIDGWWRRWPDANIGVVTGPPSGLVVLDIDPAKGGEDSLAKLERDHGPLPRTITTSTGGGGRHLYFASGSGDVRNSASKATLGRGLDVRGAGGYVVAPPSVHPSGRRYEWMVESAPDLAELPEWLRAAMVSREVAPTRVGASAKVLPGRGQAIPEGKRNDSLFRHACRARSGGAAEPAILAELRELNARSCRPPVADSELVGVAASACRYAPGHLPAELDTCDWSEADLVVDAARRKAEADESASAPPPLFERHWTPEGAPALSSVPGFVQCFVEWVLEQAARPQPRIYRATGLALLGALTGRQFQTRSGLRGNVFFLAIAGTGMGKDAAIGAARRLAQAADCSQYVGGDPGSFRGYHRMLAVHPARFFPLDELGKVLLAAQRDPRSPARATLDFLLRLYSHSVAGGELPAHVIAKAADSSPAVAQACTSLVGFSTEEAWDALTPSAASDGWLPRFLLVEGDPDAPLRQGDFLPPPAWLVAAVLRVVGNVAGHDYELTSDERMDTEESPRAVTLVEDSNVAAVDQLARHASDQWAREARKAGRPWLADLTHRWRENALKLAMLRAVSRWSMEEDQGPPALLAEDLLWGLAHAEDSIRRMALALAQRVGANEHDLLTKRLRRLLACEDGANAWVFRSALRRALGGGRVDTRAFEDAIRTLVDLEDIETMRAQARSVTGGGRPAEAYRLTPSGRRRVEG